MTFQEMIASLSPNTNDSLAILTNALEQLGALPVGATNLEIMHFVEAGRAQVAWKLREPSWAVPAVRSSHCSWSDIGDRVTVMTNPLAKLHEAMKRPAPNAGSRTNCFEVATPWPAVRRAALWLASEALLNLHTDRQAAALASVEAIAGLAELHREEYSLVSQMTRLGVANIGLDLTWEALQAKHWSDQDLVSLQKCWAKFDFLEAVERGLEGERCFGRESVKRAKAQSLWAQNGSSQSYYETNFLDADLLFQLRHVEGYVEQVRCLRAGRGWSEVSQTLDQLNARVDALTNPPACFRYLMTLLATPNFKRAVWKGAQTETQRRLAITAIALERYQRKHGRFPRELDQLAPEFLPAVPRDCMDAQPLRYRLQDGDAFRLYSVGENGRDDGGDPSPIQSHGKPGLWEGRDAVWPSAVPGSERGFSTATHASAGLSANISHKKSWQGTRLAIHSAPVWK